MFKRKNFYLPEQLVEALTAYCAKFGYSEAEVVRLALRRFFENAEAKNNV
jgi:hypothetical protein